MNLRTIAFTGIASLAGLGLVGVGAHAAFTTSNSASQPIVAGTPQAVIYATGATNGCTSLSAADASPSSIATCQSITLPVQTIGSTFDVPNAVWVANVGNIPVSVVSFAVNDSSYGAGNNPDGWLAAEMGLCVYDPNNVAYPANGPLSGYSNNTTTPLAAPVALSSIGSTTYFGVDLFAGENSSYGCGFTHVPALDENASGGSDTVTITMNYQG